MRLFPSRLLLTLAVASVAGFSLAGCAQTGGPSAAAASATDDDALCRGKGPPGSNDYAACMKNRDVARVQSETRIDRSHRRVAEDMLNGR